jgi:hypothetical protein
MTTRLFVVKYGPNLICVWFYTVFREVAFLYVGLYDITDPSQILRVQFFIAMKQVIIN